MHKGFLKAGALIGALSVILGAFAAHKIKGMVSDNALAIFETAVRYQFYHAFALIFTGILYKEFSYKCALWAGRLFIAGIILFSGSLYFLAYLQATVTPGYAWVGPVRPLAGPLSLQAGFAYLSHFLRKGIRKALYKRSEDVSMDNV
jgi:uncharacterized membrane protein YgdD (TMEM256/DUF423 family)